MIQTIIIYIGLTILLGCCSGSVIDDLLCDIFLKEKTLARARLIAWPLSFLLWPVIIPFIMATFVFAFICYIVLKITSNV
jgi:hypothetical protein